MPNPFGYQRPDAAGNVRHQEMSRTPVGQPTTTTISDYKYVGNQLVQSIIAGQTAKYLYDADGNLNCVAQGAWTSSSEPCPAAGAGLAADYGYDYLNRLTSFSRYTTGGTLFDDAKYTYDALGRPTSQTEAHTAPGGSSIGPEKKTTFAYQGLTDLVTQEQHLSATGSLKKTNSYTYDVFGHRIGMSWTPDPDGDPSTDDGANQRKNYTYSYDIHGSTSLLIDEATGKASASYGYDPYGGTEKELTTERDPSDPTKEIAADDQLNPYRYSGKRVDPGSGTYDMGARRFGPDTERYLQEDRYLGALADLDLSLDPLTQNRYALAGGNPISYIETDGHMLAPSGSGGTGANSDATAARSFSRARATAEASGGDGSSLLQSARAQEDYYSSYGGADGTGSEPSPGSDPVVRIAKTATQVGVQAMLSRKTLALDRPLRGAQRMTTARSLAERAAGRAFPRAGTGTSSPRLTAETRLGTRLEGVGRAPVSPALAARAGGITSGAFQAVSDAFSDEDYTTEQRVGRVGLASASGAVSAAAGAAAAGVACGPGAPVCALAIGTVVGVGVSIGANEVVDEISEKLGLGSLF